MSTSIVRDKVDKMLLAGASFDKIMSLTGWTEGELWIYIDMFFRIAHPEFCKNNKHYCVWGLNEKEQVKTR